MSYYRVVSWYQPTNTVGQLQHAGILNYVGDNTECHLNIHDDTMIYHLTHLMEKFDVMFIERSGTQTIMLDAKGGQFRQR
jgi:hypothetical protein